MKRHASMNRVYRVIWSKARGAWMVVGETVRGQGKGPGSRKLLAAALVLMAAGAQAGPDGGKVTAGSGTISQSGNTTTINQASQNLSLTWKSFNTSASETVNFLQPSASALAVNRIFDTNGTQFLGRLNANGQVWLINPNGILFGHGSQVNVGGLVASTLDYSESANKFSGSGTGSVVNKGSISAADGGYVALLGNKVANGGAIVARLGTAALGAGSAATLTFAGNSLVKMQVDESVLNSVASNGGLIHADGGHVLMSAGAKNSLLASVVNNTGVIEARTVEAREGRIVLLAGMKAGTTKVSGTLDASAPNGGNGGFIETSAAHVHVANDAKVTTLAASGKTGKWLIDPQDFTIAAADGDITGTTLSSSLSSTDVEIQSSGGGTSGSGDINVNDAVSWSANALTLTAARDVNINAVMTASGTSALTMNTATANGADSGVSGGKVKVGMDATGFIGRVDFPGRSGTGILTINGEGYTVINSLGNEGSTTGTDLQGIAGAPSGRYALGASIDASATGSWEGGAGFKPVSFGGAFDGLGHTISTLTISRISTENVGLFATTDAAAVIRNVGLENGAATGHRFVGRLAGRNAGSISNSYASGFVGSGCTCVFTQPFGTGGLVGVNTTTGTISDSHSTVVQVNGIDFVGGLVGVNYGTVSRSYATGNVRGFGLPSGIGGRFVGGLTGGNFGTVDNSYATGTPQGLSSIGGLVGTSNGLISNSYASGFVGAGSYAGGLVGSNSGAISNSYATGSVSINHGGSSYAGGLGGRNTGSITNSYATGSVSGGNNIGGLVGGNSFAGTISKSYATGNVNGDSNAGGLVGSNTGGPVTDSLWNTETSGQPTSAGGTGLTTAKMKSVASFAGWDIANAGGSTSVWRIYEGNTAPLLRSFLTPLTLADAPDTTFAYNARVRTGPASGVSDAHIFGAAATGRNAGLYNGYYSDQAGWDLKGGNLIIKQRNLALAGLTAQDKTYDATRDATLGGTPNIASIIGDDVSLSGTPSGQFVSKVAGANRAVSVTGVSLDGADAGNYHLVAPTLRANIAKADLEVTGVTVRDKRYDSTNVAYLVGTPTVSPLGSDVVIVKNLKGTFNDVNVGTGKPVTSSLVLTGVDARNYNIIQPTGLTGNITQATLKYVAAPLTITAGTSPTGLLTGIVTGFYGSDNLLNSTSGSLIWTTTGKSTSLPGLYRINGGGLTSSNYRIAQDPSNGTALTIEP